MVGGGTLQSKSPILSPKRLALDELMKVEWLMAHVCIRCWFPARAEIDFLSYFLIILLLSWSIFVTREAPCDL